MNMIIHRILNMNLMPITFLTPLAHMISFINTDTCFTMIGLIIFITYDVPIPPMSVILMPPRR